MADPTIMSLLLSSFPALQQEHDRSDIPHLAWLRRLPLDSSPTYSKGMDGLHLISGFQGFKESPTTAVGKKE